MVHWYNVAGSKMFATVEQCIEKDAGFDQNGHYGSEYGGDNDFYGLCQW